MYPRVLMRRLRIVGGIALALALTGLCAYLFATLWRPPLSAFPRQGMHVGEAQGAIDWWAVKRDGEVQFVYLHATTGAEGHDRSFGSNWRGAWQAGIPRGAIHRFSLCQLAADQAGNYVATVPRNGHQLPPAVELDFDADCAARPAREVVLSEIQRFLAGVEGYLGRPAILKVSPAFEAHYHPSAAIPRPIWAARAFFLPDDFDKPWTMWQASSFRRIAGVAGPVYWDVMAR